MRGDEGGGGASHARTNTYTREERCWKIDQPPPQAAHSMRGRHGVEWKKKMNQWRKTERREINKSANHRALSSASLTCCVREPSLGRPSARGAMPRSAAIEALQGTTEVPGRRGTRGSPHRAPNAATLRVATTFGRAGRGEGPRRASSATPLRRAILGRKKRILAGRRAESLCLGSGTP